MSGKIVGKNGGARPGAGNKSGSARTESRVKLINVGLTQEQIDLAKAITGCKSAYAACKALILLALKNSENN